MNAHEGPIAAREFATEWDAEAERLLAEYERAPLPQLLASAQALGREGHGNVVSYSRKVFIPLTRLCRDVCGYCTFATTPRRVASAYLSPDEVLVIASATRPRARRSPGSVTRARSNISAPCARWCSPKPDSCRTSTPA